MQDCLVSVIVPIYNIEEYVDACVESVCNQTFDNLEIILVDDGSTDNSGAKCDFWLQKDSRISVIHKKNGGLSSARNAGLDVAQGKYIYFADGDDTIESNLVESVVSNMEKQYDMVVFGYASRSADNSKYWIPKILGEIDISESSNKLSFIVNSLLQYRIGWEAWSRMYRRDIIEHYHLRFEDNRVIFAEDLYFCLCYCSNIKKIYCMSECFYNYIQRSNSIMGTDSKKLNIGRMNELSKAVLKYFKQTDVDAELINHFPLIHYRIIENVLQRALRNNFNSYTEFRELVKNDVSDWDFFVGEMRKVSKYKKLLEVSFSGSKFAEDMSVMKYLCDGSYLGLRIRNRLIYRFANQLDMRATKMQKLNKMYKQFSKKQNKIYLLGSEEYGNIGDFQINESILLFIKNHFPKCNIIEVTGREYKEHKKLLMKYIESKDLIIFVGGGNIGDEYPAIEMVRRDAISTWPKNRKIIFPQTIHFSDTEKGRSALKESQESYTEANNVILFTRETVSFEMAQKCFQCRTYLVPDIVLSTNYQKDIVRNDTVLVCFRSDVEKTLTHNDEMFIRNQLMKNNIKTVDIDLQLPFNVSKLYRREEIDKKISQWQTSKMVITDRLHGMVFAAITGTPCIVFSNYNHKVAGTYEWIKELPYIRFVSDVNEFEKNMLELLELKTCKYDNSNLMKEFQKLEDVIREGLFMQ